MDYPNLTLKITKNQPTIELRSDDKNLREIFAADMDLDTYLAEVQTALGGEVADLPELITNGDDQLVDFSELDLGDEELNLGDVLKIVVAKAKEYEQVAGLAAELAAELKRNWDGDILASAIEGAYNLLIAKVIIWADTLGVEDIALEDDRLEPRLREKMSSELAKFDTQLLVA